MTLAGTVPSEDAKRRAMRIARRTDGAAAIPGAKAGEDWWLTGWRVEGPDNRWNLVVEADDGTVWLEGDVPRPSIIRKALENARQVEGVRTFETRWI